jgi:hypothetical protein
MIPTLNITTPNKIQLESCRVCGFHVPHYSLWGEDGNTPSFDICPCCSVQIGHDDCDAESARLCRAQWFATGCAWVYPEDKPVNWDLAEQLKNIRPDYL